jgi:hypothetical protein
MLVPKAHALGRETFDRHAYTAQTGDWARLPEILRMPTNPTSGSNSGILHVEWRGH